MEIAALLAQYLQAPPPQQIALRTTHSSLFTDDVVASLDAARLTLREAQERSEEVRRDVTNIVRGADLPDGLNLTNEELRALSNTEEMMISRFAEHMEALLSQRLMCAHELHGKDALLPVNQSNTVTLWYQQSSIVLEILSFLPVECTLGVAEEVCMLWQNWLGDPSLSRKFWTDCVRREFTENFHMLVESEGKDLLHNGDWRMIAMICCTDDDDDDNNNGVGSEETPVVEQDN
ncbi:uncharacterized protein TM35_001981010 [Trypanosoma theileri]|uniref:Uncharacterized protein n=1 Tax=Trypanosoma theileri TaxID=67003 RepID=A0A1X0ND66_9TRYP|nr:uncharacterized protein TM35_001981010 [Trypanosoma theileri]ORC79868.1 hypothetical protein TM35_001981010 [Trypanosoma theileri]